MKKYFEKYFNSMESNPKNGSGISKLEKRSGRLVWNSKVKGTYVRAIHGKLPNN
jgi:hypothetical protein